MQMLLYLTLSVYLEMCSFLKTFLLFGDEDVIVRKREILSHTQIIRLMLAQP